MTARSGPCRRAGRAQTQALVAEVEASELHVLLHGQGFQLRPFRIPRGLVGGNLRLRLTWQKSDAAEVRTVRLTHTVIVPNRV